MQPEPGNERDESTRQQASASMVVRALPAARRWLTLLMLLVVSWCVMTFTHETGHLIGGWVGGGTLRDADLVPWHLPYSHFDPDPRPLLTLWCGPALGVLVPLMGAWLARSEWIWFVAQFCMLANGVYLAAAWFSGEQLLDTAKLLRHGAAPATIAIYCLLTIGIGYAGFRRSFMRVLSPAAGSQALVSTNQETSLRV